MLLPRRLHSSSISAPSRASRGPVTCWLVIVGRAAAAGLVTAAWGRACAVAERHSDRPRSAFHPPTPIYKRRVLLRGGRGTFSALSSNAFLCALLGTECCFVVVSSLLSQGRELYCRGWIYECKKSCVLYSWGLLLRKGASHCYYTKNFCVFFKAPCFFLSL
jgi:hypothetical protein